MKIVGLEEHFATAEVINAWKNVDPCWRDLALKASIEGDAAQRLLDFGPKRLAAMDEAGIDVVAVLSLTTPGVQNLGADMLSGWPAPPMISLRLPSALSRIAFKASRHFPRQHRSWRHMNWSVQLRSLVCTAPCCTVARATEI